MKTNLYTVELTERRWYSIDVRAANEEEAGKLALKRYRESREPCNAFVSGVEKDATTVEGVTLLD